MWTPLVLASWFHLVWRHRVRLPVWSLWLALGGVAYSVVQAALNEWTGGAGFNGYRLTLELLLCLAPACAMAATYAGGIVRRLAPYLVGYQLAVTSVAALIGEDHIAEEDFWIDCTVLVGLREETTLTVMLLAGFGIVGWLVTRWAMAGWWWPGLHPRQSRRCHRPT